MGGSERPARVQGTQQTGVPRLNLLIYLFNLAVAEKKLKNNDEAVWEA